jgi:predicted metal-binding membrane protein
MAMAMGFGSLPSFTLMWVAMTAAMMAPSAAPFVVSFARRAPRTPLPTAVLIAVYLLVWTCFGIAVFYASMAISVSLPAATATALAIAFVGLYALTPVMRAGRERCVDMCRRADRINGLGLRAAVVEGITYGISCVVCSGAVMLAVVVLGMSNIIWIAAGAAMVLLYKLARPWTRRVELGASVVCVATAAWLMIA